MTGVGGVAEEPLPPKRTRGPATKPVRSEADQTRAIAAAQKWAAELGSIDLDTVVPVLRGARLEADVFGFLLDGDEDAAAKRLAKADPDTRAEIALVRAGGQECMRRARSAAIQVSFELGLVKKLVAAGWLPSASDKLSHRCADHCAAVKWWRARREIRSRRSPLMVKGAPRPFPRNN